MIFGYPEEPNVLPGGRLVLRVSTDARAFRVLIYRWGMSMELVLGTDWFPGRRAPRHLPFQDWGRPNAGAQGQEQAGWAGYPIDVPTAWSSGVYIAVLTEGDGGCARLIPTTHGSDGIGSGRICTSMVDQASFRTPAGPGQPIGRVRGQPPLTNLWRTACRALGDRADAPRSALSLLGPWLLNAGHG
jgi:hypothetical protein